MKCVLVLGASGVMGGRIVRLAGRTLPGVEVVRGSRGAGRQPGGRAVDVQDRASLREALKGVDAVINAVGPFDYDPVPLLDACREAGCPCVDLAETPDYIARAIGLARRHGTKQPAVVSGCSTVPGLVEVLAQHWAGREEVVRVRVLLSMGSANPVSPTLLYSLLRPLGAPAPDGSRYYDRLVRKRLRDLPARVYGRYPSPFDGPGIAVGNRLLPATFYAGMDRGTHTSALWLAARVLPHTPSQWLRALCRLARPVLPLVRVLGTPVGVLSIEALDREGNLAGEVEVRAAREGLNVPALPSLWAVRALLAQGDVPAGPLSLQQLVTPGQAAAWLREEGYEVRGSGRAVDSGRDVG